MLIIPAIDLKEGRCVRLIKGDPNRETVYSDSPCDQAKIWEEQGAKLLHIVDLDGAFEGIPKNLSLIEDIRKSTDIDLEIGGGIRDLKTIEHYINIGIHRIIIGSAAYENRDFVKSACEAFPGKIIVGIDVVDNMVAIHGWKTITKTHLHDFGKEMKDLGVSELIITDINRDGLLTGIDPDFYRNALKETGLPIIASGGVSSILDVKKLIPLKKDGLKGIITGKAVYEKKLDIKEAIEVIHAG